MNEQGLVPHGRLIPSYLVVLGRKVRYQGSLPSPRIPFC